MEEEGAVGQRSRRSPSPRRSPPAVEGVLVGDEGGDIESRPTHVTWEEWAMSGNDARYDADAAVLVAAITIVAVLCLAVAVLCSTWAVEIKITVVFPSQKIIR